MPTSRRSYRSPTREEASAATRARIIAEATALLSANGWAKLSLDAVGRAAGVTRLTVYNQFGSRRALLEAVFDARAAEGGFAGIGAIMQLDDPRAAVEAVARHFCQFWRTNTGFMPAMAAESAADPEFAEALQARNERRRQIFTTLVGRLAAGGEVRSGEVPGVVDTLFALTSYPFYAQLLTPRHDQAEVSARIVMLCLAVLDGARQ